jgi:hypothetical protein
MQAAIAPSPVIATNSSIGGGRGAAAFLLVALPAVGDLPLVVFDFPPTDPPRQQHHILISPSLM